MHSGEGKHQTHQHERQDESADGLFDPPQSAFEGSPEEHDEENGGENVRHGEHAVFLHHDHPLTYGTCRACDA